VDEEGSFTLLLVMVGSDSRGRLLEVEPVLTLAEALALVRVTCTPRVPQNLRILLRLVSFYYYRVAGTSEQRIITLRSVYIPGDPIAMLVARHTYERRIVAGGVMVGRRLLDRAEGWLMPHQLSSLHRQLLQLDRFKLAVNFGMHAAISRSFRSHMYWLLL